MRIRRHTFNTALALTATVAALALASCSFSPPSSGHPFAGGSPSASCGECHGAIYDEWRQSTHARAYTNEEFRVATENYTETKCLPCHVPASLDKLTDPPVRTARLDEGVNCESCHLTDGAYGAPTLFSEYSNHKMTVRADLAASEFCGRCHKPILAQWSKVNLAAKNRKTCQDCHMPTIRRKTVSGSFWHGLHPQADTHHHGFATIKPVAPKVNVVVKLAVETISPERVAGTVTLTNVTAHHSLPSGEFGFRELAAIISLRDRYGVASAKHVARFLPMEGSHLEYDTPRAVKFDFKTVPYDAAVLDVRLLRSTFAGVEAELFHTSRPIEDDLPEAEAGKE